MAQRVFLVCPGIGHVRRGFESFTEECWRALGDDSRLECYIFKGKGNNTPRNFTVPCLKRGSNVTKVIARVLGRDPYFWEQVTFAIGLVPFILRYRPELIFFSDGTVGNVLWRVRDYLPGRPALLFSNGAPLFPPYCKCDHVHETLPHMMEVKTTEKEIPRSFIPYGFSVAEKLQPVSYDQKRSIRAALNLPPAATIILSVAALSKQHKRVDYLISEVAKLKLRKPFLLCLGEETAETPELKALADRLLGVEGYRFATVDYKSIDQYYRASDALCHVAYQEGFGRSMVEALAWGLPVFAHESSGNRFVLGAEGIYGDFAREGVLATLLERLRTDDLLAGELFYARHAQAFKNFSWNALRDQYVKMFLEVIAEKSRMRA